MKRRVYQYLLMAICLIVALPTWGAWGYRSISMDDGLAANAVRNIVQDKDGFIWLGTDNGLCRYDGTHVQHYRIQALGMNQYVSALLATDDHLYIGTDNALFRFSLTQNRFEPISLDLHSTVTAISCDKDGNLWVSTQGQGAWQYVPQTGQSHHYDFKAWGGAVARIFVDADNQIWAVTNWGEPAVSRLNRLHDQFEPALPNGSYQQGALCMLQTRDGRLWIGSWEQGLLLLHSDGHLEQMFSPAETKMGYHIHTLYERSADCICIGCDDGVVCFNPLTRQCHRMSELPQQECRFVYSIIGDNEGGLWIGTFYGGAAYVSPVGKRFEGFSLSDAISTPSGEGLTGNVIARFCEDPQGRLWIASDDGGLMCYLLQEGRFTDYPHRETLQGLNAHALAMDGDDLWIGTYTSGIHVLNTVSGQLRHYAQAFGSKPQNDISSYAVCRDRQGTMWVATMSGLCRYDRESDRLLFHHALGALTIDMKEDRQGRLWLATEGGGLWRYTPGKDIWKQYRYQADNSHSLAADEVNSILIDQSGRLWVGTGNGLCRYDEATDGFERMAMDVPNQNVMAIVEDHGQLWLSTERGIVKYVPGEGVQRFTRHDGLVSEQFQPNSGLKTSDGRIFFGSTNGFNIFQPYQIKANSVVPPVYITSMELTGHEQLTDDGLPLDLSHTPELELGYGDARMVSLSFASLSYCSPEKNQYAYMLEGFDRDWNYVGNQHKATYTNLPAGTYTFRVRATNNDGIWSDHEATLRIVVHPPFWWSWWAKLCYFVMAVASIWYYVHLRLRRAEQRHQQELQRQSEEKEREVREARLHFFTTIAHEIRTPVSLIIGPLEQLKNERLTDGNRSTFMGHLEVIDRNAHRLLELVNQLLDFRKVEQKSLTMHFAPENIGELLHAVCERFAPTFEQGGKQFTVDYPDEHFTAIVDREGVTKVVSNLLTNAVKYSRTKVHLNCIVEADGDHFRIEVEDDGMGIGQHDLQHIFEPFFQAQTSKPGTGIGLNIVKTIVDLHQGTVDVESQEGKGSKFVVRLNIKDETLNVKDETLKAKDEALCPATPGDASPAKNFPSGDVRRRFACEEPSTFNFQPSTSHLLLVEDDPDMRTFLTNHFAASYTVITAGNGIEALRQLARHTVALIVSDWMMPGMDGAEFCRRVRQNSETSHIPFILLTAKTDDDSKVMGLDVGADAYLEKPFSLKVLDACLRSLLQRRKELLRRFSQEPDEPISPLAGNALDNEFLNRMNSIIEANIANSDFSVNTLAEQMNISRSSLFAKIKSIADVTPNEMIQIVRLKRAAQLLAEGRYRINEVSYMVGFSSPSYFAKCFHRQFGKKPGEVAKA